MRSLVLLEWFDTHRLELKHLAELADFNFTIKYRPGRSNADADVLSRMPLDIEDYRAQCTSEISSAHLGATVDAVQAESCVCCPWVDALTVSLQAPMTMW